MEIKTNDNYAAMAMLERASEVLEVTYYDWRLHELPPPGTKRSRKRRKASATNHQGRGFYAPANYNAFA